MALIKAKQIDKLLGTLRRFDAAFTLAATGSVSLATAFTGKTSGGSNTVAGVFTTAPTNKVVLISDTTGSVIDDGAGNSVYGRINGAFNCSFYTIVAGVETTYTILAGNVAVGSTVSVVYAESVQLKDIVATDVVNGLDAIDETDADPNAHYEKSENITIASNGQTAFTLTSVPKAASVKIFINGQLETTFTHAGVSTSVTWLNTDYALETTDTFRAVYNV
jgi:hypothetical protein